MSDPTSPAGYPPIYPHDPIEEIAPDVFMVRGSINRRHGGGGTHGGNTRSHGLS